MNYFIIIITSILGATLTFYVANHLKQGATRASALLSLIVGLFFYSFPGILNEFLTKNIPLVFIGASFIGMVSPRIVSRNYIVLFVAGILFGIIYNYKNNFFEGYGGALGALAFIALLITNSFFKVFSKNEIN